MDRRTFLALLSTPAVVGLLQACGNDDSSGPATTGSADTTGPTTPGGAAGEARSLVARRPADPALAAQAAAAVNAFGADLYTRLAGDGSANLVCSPTSIALALAMTRAGAAGATAAEMDQVLHVADVGADPAALHLGMNSLTTELEARSGTFDVMGQPATVQLSIANSLWGQDGIAWVETFLDLLATQYGAGMRLVDYMADTEGARQAINAWVADETEDRIPELLGQGTITPDSRLTLVNAVYLKAPWLEPFPESQTTQTPFTTVAGSAVEVAMMRTRRSLPYASGDGWQAVDLPYAGGALSMLIVVPDQGALGAVEGALEGGLLDQAAATLSSRDVIFGMPRFDLETKVELNDVLASLGMPSAFAPGSADFSGMTAEERLFVGMVIHQANITVDETGTEAAAATAVGMRATSAPSEPPIELTLDRPFLYAVRDIATGAVLFLGRVSDPS
jgi:serpin B